MSCKAASSSWLALFIQIKNICSPHIEGRENKQSGYCYLFLFVLFSTAVYFCTQLAWAPIQNNLSQKIKILANLALTKKKIINILWPSCASKWQSYVIPARGAWHRQGEKSGAAAGWQPRHFLQASTDNSFHSQRVYSDKLASSHPLEWTPRPLPVVPSHPLGLFPFPDWVLLAFVFNSLLLGQVIFELPGGRALGNIVFSCSCVNPPTILSKCKTFLWVFEFISCSV